MKTFGELSREEKIELFAAWVDGKPIEYSNSPFQWQLVRAPSWAPTLCYRVKATQDYIDWNQVQPQYKWMARDPSGEGLLFPEKPHIMSACWGCTCRPEDVAKVSQSSYVKGTIDWKDSLVKRGE